MCTHFKLMESIKSQCILLNCYWSYNSNKTNLQFSLNILISNSNGSHSLSDLWQHSMPNSSLSSFKWTAAVSLLSVKIMLIWISLQKSTKHQLDRYLACQSCDQQLTNCDIPWGRIWSWHLQFYTAMSS